MIDHITEPLPLPNPWLQAIRALASSQRFEEAEQKALNWTLHEPENSESWRQLAAMRECQKNYTGALAAASSALACDAENPAAWWYRGYQHLLVDSPYLAELDFDNALALSSSSKLMGHVQIARFMRAQARRQLGDYQGALDDCAYVPRDTSFWLHAPVTVDELTAHCLAALEQGYTQEEEG